MFRKIWFGFLCFVLILAFLATILFGILLWLNGNKLVDGPKPAEGYSSVLEQYRDYAEKYCFDEEIVLPNDSELKLNFDDFSVLKSVDKEGKVTLKVESYNSSYILNYSKDAGITDWSDDRTVNMLSIAFFILLICGLLGSLWIICIKACWEEVTC